MAATNFTPIQLYFSTTASAVPTAANLAQGELAINITDGKLYYEDNAGAVQVIATKGAGTIGGSTTQIQYNNAGALAGSASMTFNSGTNVTTLTTLNLTNALGAIYGGTSQSAYAQGDVLYASATNTLSKLGIGTVNYILTSTGSVPQWVAPTSITVNTATNLAGGAGGSVPYQSAADTTTFLAIGAANRVMTSSGTAPQWVTALTGLTGVSSSSITNTSLTATRLVYSSTAGLQTDSANLTFDGTTLSATGYSTTGLSTLVKTVKIGDSNFSGVAVFAPATPAKLYIGTGTVTDTTSAIGATNATGAVASLAITPIAATNTSVTYTNAATLYIAGAPSAGTNVTLTNPYSLYVAAGASYFGGTVTFASSIGALTVSSLTDTGLTSGRVTYATTGGLLTDSANLTFDGSNLGVGITPSNAYTSGKVLQIVSGGVTLYGSATTASVLSNSNLDSSGNAIFQTANAASSYRQAQGTHQWNVSTNTPAIGTVISFNAAMSLTSSGLLLVAAASSLASTYQLQVGGAFQSVSTNLISVTDTSTVYRGTPDGTGYGHAQVYSGRDATTTTYGTYLAFYTENKNSGTSNTSQEKGRFTAGGTFLVGATAAFNSTADVGLFARSQASISRVLIDNQNIAGTSSFEMSSYGGGWSLQVPGSATFVNQLDFKFGNNQRVRFGSAGNIGFGTQGTTADRLVDMSFQGATTSGATQFGVVLNPTYPTTVTSSLFNLYAGPNLTAGTTVTNVYGLYLEGINAVGSTVTNRYGVYQASASDENYFGGNVRLNASVARNRLTVVGTVYSTPTLGVASGNIYSGDTNYGTMFGTSGFGYGWIQQQRVDGTASAYDLYLQPVGGNVAIGGGTPANRLDVLSNIDRGGVIVRNTSNTNYRGYYIGATGGDSASYAALELNANSGELRHYVGPAGYGGYQTFYTAGTQAMQIDGNQRMQINTNTALYSATVTILSASNSYNITSSRAGGGVGVLGHIVFENDNGAVGTIQTVASITAYNTSSDYRLKNITGPITNSGAYIDSLEPCEGTWVADGSVFVGLVAHKTQEVSRTPVATGVKDGDVMQGMDYSSPEIIANLIAEVQSLRKRLAAANI